ncbi:MAG: hypothetical protein ACT4P1_02510 [Sporichthyaceae bacterium]
MAAALSIVAVGLTAPAPASAVGAPLEPVCASGQDYTLVHLNYEFWSVTHASPFLVASYQEHTETRSADFVKVASSKVSGNVGITGNASAFIRGVLAQAGVAAGASVAKDVQETTRESVTITDRFVANKKQRRYAAAAARRVYEGTWERRHCDADGYGSTVITSGKWETFSEREVRGFVLCNRNYRSDSLEGAVCTSAYR